ncbi:MAG: hypothetical protein NVS3B25_25190 [Hymenobacter sp.]
MEDEFQDTHANDDHHDGWEPTHEADKDWCPQDTDEQGELLPF